MALGTQSWLIIFGGVLGFCFWFINFARRFRKHRAFYRELPCPPHDFWFGHLKIMGEAMNQLPGVHPQVVMAYIGQKYNMPGIFYLDLYPASSPMIMIHDPGVANQITLTNSLPKHAVNGYFLGSLVGNKSIVLVEGTEWKMIRSVVMPGFAPKYLSSLQPTINKHVLRFADKLRKYAEDESTHPLQDALIGLAIDVIAEVVLGTDLETQKTEHPVAGSLAYYFRRAVVWAGSSMDLVRFQLSRPMKWYYTRHQDRLILAMLRKRHKEVSKAERGRAAVDLFLEAYENEKMGTSGNKRSAIDDPAFLEIAVSNVKSLLLGGHDTTATTICYTIGLLSQNLQSLKKIRAEHDEVFGHQGAGAALKAIGADTSLLNKLPYTTACIKEATRIFAPASTTRSAGPGTIQSVNYDGVEYPIAGHALWVSHYGIGHREDIWPDSRKFIPERHMPDPPHTIVKDAWRTFERGPRACLGLELAMNEAKTALVAVVRDFDFEVAYPKDAPRVPEAFGGQMYQVTEMAAKPTLHMPVKIRKRNLCEA